MTQHTFTPAAAGRLAPLTPLAPLPAIEEQTALTDPLPKLRIWAAYPDGSHPESIEVTYDAEGPVTAELIAGILQALPGSSVQVGLTGTSIKPGALTRALEDANRSLKGAQQ
jgi:hypothetical protein